MKYINIIGGSGFIGSRLTRRLMLEQGSCIKIIDKVTSDLYPELVTLGDVRVPCDMRNAISDRAVIINLAAEHNDNVNPRELYDEVNIQGAINICAVAKEKKVNTIIFTSSVAVYGFARINTDESGAIKPFNDYGRTKYEAEQIFRIWQAEAPSQRTLVIIRPTVVFGERNRGNVYKLLRQISLGKFVMVGSGQNRKSMAYVENVAAFIQHCITFSPGIHIYNYIDKPDFTMKSLVLKLNRIIGRSEKIQFRVPYVVGLIAGKIFDLLAILTGRDFSISSIRVKKFCADSVYATAISETGFIPPVNLEDAIEGTVRYEFIESHDGETLYF